MSKTLSDMVTETASYVKFDLADDDGNEIANRIKSAINEAKNILAQRVETTEEYRTYAAMINTLLMRFPEPDITQSDWSVANWHVPNVKHFAVSTQKVVIPVAVLNKDYQENKPAIWFTARDKGDVCHLVIGFNLGDKRPEVGKCETPKTPQTTPPSGPPTKPPSGPPTKPPKDKCPPGYVGKPPKCLESKKANQDPAQNGNAGNGGGKNQDPGPGPTTKPTTVPSAPRTNPPPPSAPEPTREDPPPPKEQPTDPPKTGDPGGF